MLSPASKEGAEEYPYLGNADVQWGSINLDGLRTMSFTAAEQAEFALRAGDVLVCEGGEVGRTAVVEHDLEGVFFQKAIHRVRCSDQLHPMYLYRFMQFAATTGRLDDFSSQATIKHLTGVKLRKVPIPLPPIEEQRRIAAVLDAADALRVKRRRALARLDELPPAIFVQMFGAAAGSPVPRRPIGELVRSPITRGIDQPGPDVEGGVPYIKTKDFGSVNPTRASLARSSREIAGRFPRSVVEEGDIVVCIRATVGPALLVDEGLDGANLSRGTARLSPSSEVLPEFLFGAVRSDEFQRQIQRKLRGATFLQIPLGELKALEVPHPPLDRQRAFVLAWAEVQRQLRLQRHQTEGLDTLFLSLQARAFRGEL